MTANDLLLIKPKQQRSIDKIDAIEAAVHRIILANGVFSMTTNSIAKEAGVDIKMLYRFFESKEAVALYCLVRQVALFKEDAASESADFSMFLRKGFTPWWKIPKKLDNMIVIHVLRLYSVKCSDYFDSNKKEIYKILCNRLKSYGASGTVAEWRESLEIATHVQSNVLYEVNRINNTKAKQKKLFAMYERFLKRELGRFFCG